MKSGFTAEAAFEQRESTSKGPGPQEIQLNDSRSPWCDTDLLKYRILRDDGFIAIRDLVASVRAAGSWKAHCKLAHKEVLRLRSLVARGRAKLPRARRRSPRSHDARQKRVLEFLMRQGDNGTVWNILSFWCATN